MAGPRTRTVTRVDPVDIKQITSAAIAAGAIVLFGATYAVFHALSRLRGDAMLARLAIVSYGLLALATLVLAEVLHLKGPWFALVVLLLVGYFVAPRFIWRLSVAVHEAEEENEARSEES